MYTQMQSTILSPASKLTMTDWCGEDAVRSIAEFADLVHAAPHAINVVKRMAVLLQGSCQEWREVVDRAASEEVALKQSEAKFEIVLCMAKELKDTKLQNQVNFLNDVDCMKMKLAAIKSKMRGARNRQDKALSADSVELMIPAKAFAKGLRAQAVRSGFMTDLFSSALSEDLHFNIFAKQVDGEALLRACLTMYDQASQALLTQWSKDLDDLSDRVVDMCPPWQAFSVTRTSSRRITSRSS